MPWEAALWSLALIISPIAAGWAWPRVQESFGDWREPLEAAAPWVHSAYYCRTSRCSQDRSSVVMQDFTVTRRRVG